MLVFGKKKPKIPTRLNEMEKRLEEYFDNLRIIDKQTMTPNLGLDVAIIHQGFMSKRGGLLSQWKHRWFCLCSDATLRVIYNDGACHHMIDLTNMSRLATFKWNPTNSNGTIKLECINRNWKFMLPNKATFDNWRNHLETMIRKPMVGQSNMLCTGWIEKRGRRNKSWRRRYCELNRNGIFSYFKTKGGKAQGSFDLHHAATLSLDTQWKSFSIITHQPARTWYFKAQSQPEAEKWINVINSFSANLVVSPCEDAEEQKNEEYLLKPLSTTRSMLNISVDDGVFSKGHHGINSRKPLCSLHLKHHSKMHLKSTCTSPLKLSRSPRAVHDSSNARKRYTSLPCREVKNLQGFKFNSSPSEINNDISLIPERRSKSTVAKDVDLVAKGLYNSSSAFDLTPHPSLALIYPGRFLESKRMRETQRELHLENLTSNPKENNIDKLTIFPRGISSDTLTVGPLIRVTSMGQDSDLTSETGTANRAKSDLALTMLHSDSIKHQHFSIAKRENNLTLPYLDEKDTDSVTSVHSHSGLSQRSAQSYSSSQALSERIEDWSYKDVLRCSFYRFAGVSPYSNTNLRMSKADLDIFLECLDLKKHCDSLYSSVETDANGLFSIGDFMDVFLNGDTCNLITATTNYKFLVVTLMSMKNIDPSYSKRIGYLDFITMLSDFFTENDEPEEIFAEYDTDGVGFMHVANLFCFFRDFFELDDEGDENMEFDEMLEALETEV